MGASANGVAPLAPRSTENYSTLQQERLAYQPVLAEVFDGEQQRGVEQYRLDRRASKRSRYLNLLYFTLILRVRTSAHTYAVGRAYHQYQPRCRGKWRRPPVASGADETPFPTAC